MYIVAEFSWIADLLLNSARVKLPEIILYILNVLSKNCTNSSEYKIAYNLIISESL